MNAMAVETDRIQREFEVARVQSDAHENNLDDLRREVERTAIATRDEMQAIASEVTRTRQEVRAWTKRSRKELSKKISENTHKHDTDTVVSDLKMKLSLVEAKCAALQSSTSWEITAPLRLIKTALAKPDVFTGKTERSKFRVRPKEHWKAKLSGLNRIIPFAARSAPVVMEPSARVFPPSSHATMLQPRVLIVAELSMPQCKKYRVDQKHDMIKELGWACTIVSWQETMQVFNLIQSHSVVIFYRVPAFPSVVSFIREADCLGVPHYYELDDLVFDLDDYATNPNIVTLDPATTKGLLDGAALYRNALEQCRHVIASTPYLAERMQTTGGGSSTVVENALDNDTLHVALKARPRPNDGKVRILYGSGTRTHDADFASVALALRRVAVEHANVEIMLVGELSPPKMLLELGERLQRLPSRPYSEYLSLLAASDIAIAPLLAVNFNDAKSNIKFLEAAAVGVPAVCSPRSAFVHAIRQGQTGFLAEGVDEWHTALTALVSDPELRSRIGSAARHDVIERYSSNSIGQQQLMPLLTKHTPLPDSRLHILMVNIFYRPQSFGGATVIVEEMARLLNNDIDTRISIFTSAAQGKLEPYALERGDEDGIITYRIGVQDRPGWSEEIWDVPASEVFREALRALGPHVVHFHAIQGIGAAVLQVCREEGIPFVVTLHDAWWLCERQFLVTNKGNYCGQQRISLNVCSMCVPDISMTVKRNLKLRNALMSADLLLTPSEYWRNLYLSNGFASNHVTLNENGILLPHNPKSNQASGKLRFGFVAGSEAIKGFPLIKRTFEALKRDDWELILVNHALSMGIDSYAGVTWRAKGKVRVVPPFNVDSREAFYDSIDILLFPSQGPESFGLTVREAMIRNKWVITTDEGGAAEAIKDGVNGTLISIGDEIGPLLTAVEALLDRKPDLRLWTNPHSDRILSSTAQAKNLRQILSSVVSNAALHRAGPMSYAAQ